MSALPPAVVDKDLDAYLAALGDHPQSCIPFALDAAGAEAAFGRWLQGLALVPGDLKTAAKFNKAEPAYLPFWVISARGHASYKGEKGQHYKDTEDHTDAAGNVTTREVTRTSWSPTSGDVRHSFEGVVLPAFAGLDEKRLALVQPDLKKLAAFDPSHATRGKAERPAFSGREAFIKARPGLEAELKALAEKQIGGDERKVAKLEPRFLDPVVKLILVPVFRGSFHYGGKDYEFLMHGASGEVYGDHPVSAGKILAVVATVLLVFAAIVGSVYWFVIRPQMAKMNNDPPGKVSPVGGK